MSLIALVLVLVVIGVVLYLLESLPMDPTIKIVIRVVVIIAVCLWLLSALSGIGPMIRFR